MTANGLHALAFEAEHTASLCFLRNLELDLAVQRRNFQFTTHRGKGEDNRNFTIEFVSIALKYSVWPDADFDIQVTGGCTCLTSFTFTKAYAMAGWRLGCIVGQGSLLEPVVRVHEHTSSFVSPFVQMAGVAALTGPQDHLDTWIAEVDLLRRQVAERLNRVDGVYCPLPQGATFVFPRYAGQASSVDLAHSLVEQEGVVVTPGSGFGDSGQGHIRIALMRSPADQVLKGVERIARALESSA